MLKSIGVVLVLLCASFYSVVQAAQVRGKVLAPDGQPVTGATIWAGEMGRLDFSEKDGSLLKVTSAADGSFAFEIADSAPLALVRVQAANFALHDSAIRPGDNTLRLQQVKSLPGTVKNTKGEPVEGATVRLFFAPGDNLEEFGQAMQAPLSIISFLRWSAALPPVQTQSNANGNWQFDNVRGGIVALQDTRFAHASGVSGMDGQPNDKPIALTAKPGADLKGRLTTPDGKPLPGVYIMPGDFLSYDLQRTDADGAWTLHNVAPIAQMPNSPIVVTGIPVDSEWLVPPLIIQKALAPGQTNEAPEWKASRGIEVSGQILEKVTKVPIAKATISSGPGGAGVSDAEGRFHVRVLTGQAGMMINHPEFTNSWKEIKIPEGATSFDAGQFFLERSIWLRGRLIDEKGQPAKAAFVYVQFQEEGNRTARSASTDEDGTFKLRLPPGPITISVQEAWELPADKLDYKLTQDTPLLELKVRRVPAQLVKGRILTPEGKGIAGADVHVTVRRLGKTGEQETGTDEKIAQSDAEGRFSIQFFNRIKNPAVTKVEASGYFLRKAGDSKTAGISADKNVVNEWVLSDSLLVEMKSVASGRVLDVDGKPLSGALIIAAENNQFAPTTTDASGHFTVKNLPEGDVTLLAAHGKNFVRATAKTGADAELRLSPPSVLVASMRRQFFEQTIKEPYSTLDSYWRFIGSDKLLSIALQKDGAMPPGEIDNAKADWSKAGTETFRFVAESERREPDWLLRNGAELLKKLPQLKEGQDRFKAEAAFASVAALKGDDASRALATDWLKFAGAQKDKPNQAVENASRAFRLAGIAIALGQKNADSLVLSALTSAEMSGKKAISENSYTWGIALAAGGAKAFELLNDEWPINARVNAMAGAIRQLAPLDLKAAKALLDKLQALRQTPEFKKLLESANQEAERLPGMVDGAERNWRYAQIETDFEEGVKWLDAQSNFDWDYRVHATRAALQQKKFDLALQIMRPALEQGGAPIDEMAYFGLLSRTFDAELAARFFSKAQESLANERNDWDYNSPANYGFYFASQNPAYARLWLEAAWLKAKAASKDSNAWLVEAKKSALSGAMVALDAVRALEMLSEVSADGRTTEARARMAAFLLSDDILRPLLRVENN